MAENADDRASPHGDKLASRTESPRAILRRKSFLIGTSDTSRDTDAGRTVTVRNGIARSSLAVQHRASSTDRTLRVGLAAQHTHPFLDSVTTQWPSRWTDTELERSA